MAEFIEIIDNYGKRVLLNIDAISYICEGTTQAKIGNYKIGMLCGTTIENPKTSYETLLDFLASHNKTIDSI